MANPGQPKCRECDKPAYWDEAKQHYSPGCGKTHANQAIAKGFHGPQAIQGQPLCQMCDSPAWFDDKAKKFSPGCSRSHSQEAINLGYTKPRG